MNLVNHFEGTAMNGPIEDRCTVLVVGSGAGGAAAAYELARRGIDTVIVEEGGWYPPSSYRESKPLDAFKKLYRDYGMTTAIGKNPLRDPMVPFPLGKCVGGSTVVNSGTCLRTPETVLADWRDNFALDFAPQTLEPLFETVEDIIGVQAVPDEVSGGNAEVFARGADAMGWSGGPLPRNAPGCRGSGLCVFGCPTDAKQGTHISYVPRALTAGARLYSDVRVRRLKSRGQRVVGIEGDLMDRDANRPKGDVRIEADAVILAAGAVGTPLLLKRNRVARGNPHLGRHLRLHPGIRVAALFDERVEGWKGVPQGYHVDEFWSSLGIMYEGIFVPPGLALPSLPGAGPEFHDLCRDYPHLAMFGAMVKDTSSGSVQALGQRRHLIRYRLNRLDTERLVEAVKNACRAYFAAGARRVYPSIFGVGELTCREEVDAIDARRVRSQHLELMAFHPMGSARMAGRPEQGVLDGNGRVFGTDNLYVADASIFPNCLGVNPMESIMAFAHLIAGGIAERTSG